ncbi:SH2 domain-containing protein 1B-like isoform X3 [Lissotriton helveticus]
MSEWQQGWEGAGHRKRGASWGARTEEGGMSGFQRFIYTYRIFKIGSKFKIETAEGVQEKIFSTLRDLIVHFEKPNKGLIIPLIYPVQYQRTTCTKRKITIFPEGTYSEIKDEDYVVVLP